jgi:hypothetical protein
MERPEITLDNYEEVYEYYPQIELAKKTAKLLYGAIDGIFSPRVLYADQAQDDIDTINENNIPQIFAFNHVIGADGFISPASLHQIAPEAVGNIRILGADFNFREWYGPLFDNMGGIPLYRRQDYSGPENAEKLRLAKKAMLVCIRKCLVAGQKVAIAPEGEPNYINRAKLRELRSGVGDIAYETAQFTESPVAITPFAISVCALDECMVGASRQRSRGLKESLRQVAEAHKARICVGRSIYVQPDMDVPEIMGHVGDHLQDAVTIAHELY